MNKKNSDPKLYILAAVLFLLAGIIGEMMYCYPLAAVFFILGIMKKKWKKYYKDTTKR